ncbi:MAG: polynucleotide adenylyltransferase [Puniceicoccales bacterium]|jgi:tRNA nucleotidyltransferase (CCA-adding enzyme)|nr:polynucleotide adenylyltransferase [Puniceicoccales bacterium]
MELLLPESVGRPIRTICGRIREAGGRAYLVGGCVRDLLLAVPTQEFDLEVFSLDAPTLENLFPKALDFVGKCYGIYRFRNLPIDIGLPREERPTGPGHRDFAVRVDSNLPLETAAARRDFTVNAIYWDPLEGELVDPFGGGEDLKNRTLRHVSNHFPEDPLRVLRAMQLAARFRFSIDPRTVRLCRSLSAKNISSERICGEFLKLVLRGEAIGSGLEFLRQCDWLRFFPELAALVDCPQDPVFHPEGSVWEHVKLAMDSFAESRPPELEDALVVGFAVLCHDFGKSLRTERGADGRIRTAGHGPAGVPLAERFLQNMRMPKEIVRAVLPLVAQHMVPRTFSRPAVATVGAVRRLAWEVGRIDRLLAVARCDNRGRALAAFDFSGEDRLEKLAKSEGLFRNPPVPLVRGRDLLDFLPQSPQLGLLLKKLFEEQLDGKFSSREEGLRLARESYVG